jgi:hypothetical protein
MIENHTSFPMIYEIHTETSSLITLKIMPKLYVHEFRFRLFKIQLIVLPCSYKVSEEIKTQLNVLHPEI